MKERKAIKVYLTVAQGGGWKWGIDSALHPNTISWTIQSWTTKGEAKQRARRSFKVPVRFITL